MPIDRWLLQHGDDAQAVLFVSLFAVFAVAERAVPFRHVGVRGKRWGVNLALTLINIAALSALPVGFLAVALRGEAEGTGVLRSVSLPMSVLIVANVLGRAFISFFTHFLMHHVPVFWRVHRVHHSDTELDVSTTVRFHPLEFVIGLIPGLPLVHALGLSPAVLVAYELGDVAVTLFSHANLTLPASFERWLSYVIVTPGLHRIHHSARTEEADSNFGAVLPVWDLILGTYRRQTREPSSTMPLGLAGVRDERTTRLSWILSLPIRRLPHAPAPGDDSRPAWSRSTGETPDRTH